MKSQKVNIPEKFKTVLKSVFCTANILYLHHCSMYAKKCYLLDLKQNILCIYNSNVFFGYEANTLKIYI